MALHVPLGASLGGTDVLKQVTAPMIVAGIGTVLSVAGMLMVRCKNDNATQKELLRSLLTGTLGSSVLILLALVGLHFTGFIS